MASYVAKLTDRQFEILKKLYESGRPVKVYSIQKTQKKLADELGITRQALSNHLRKLREMGFVRTGRGFIDLTEKALATLGEEGADAFVFIKVLPQFRNEAYSQIQKIGVSNLYRVTGEIDLIALLSRTRLDEFLREVSKIKGVVETSAHIILEELSRKTEGPA